MHAIVIGGTRFIGRHAVEALLDRGYHVTIVTRGRHDNPFASHPKVTHVEGDRNDRATLEDARETATPDVVLDLVAFVPQQVATAVDVFADVGAYVYVSSAGAYAAYDVPRREGATPLEPFGPEHAVDDPGEAPSDDMSAYGARKAEGDRVCAAAADDGVAAMIARPTYVYGPHDYTERFAYWVDRVAEADRVLVPGDGDAIAHQVYVADVADALVTIAEAGSPGEAYNVGARRVCPLDERLELIADALERDVELVHAGPRELAAFDLAVDDFPLVGTRPSMLSTAKLAALGWDSTPQREAIAATVEAHREHGRTGDHLGPDRRLERDVVGALTDG